MQSAMLAQFWIFEFCINVGCTIVTFHTYRMPATKILSLLLTLVIDKWSDIPTEIWRQTKPVCRLFLPLPKSTFDLTMESRIQVDTSWSLLTSTIQLLAIVFYRLVIQTASIIRFSRRFNLAIFDPWNETKSDYGSLKINPFAKACSDQE